MINIDPLPNCNELSGPFLAYGRQNVLYDCVENLSFKLLNTKASSLHLEKSLFSPV